MSEMISYPKARDLLLEAVSPVETEVLPLEDCAGRILAEDVRASRDVPAFDRSAFDGYALRAEDLADARRESPAVLRVIGELRAGDPPALTVTPGSAVRIMTGGPIPAGANAVVQFERTREEDGKVTLFAPVRRGENVVCAGEDVRCGETVVASGTEINAGVMGLLAAQGLARICVYRVPRVGIVSTGGELAEPGEELGPGKIYDANRYMLTAALDRMGCEGVFLGHAGDDASEIARLIRDGVARCDALILTGGVSVGRYDLTPGAIEDSGVTILFRGVDMKPGKACAYGKKGEKLVCALSGNPAAALTNLYAVAAPALGRLCGRRDCLPTEVTVTLEAAYPKPSPRTRLLRGRLHLNDGILRISLPDRQGNSVLSSAVGCSVIAVVPAGSGPLEAGAKLGGFLI